METAKQVVVNNYIYRMLLNFMDSCDASEVADSITNEVLTDIEETADLEFNHCDIEIAFARVLKKHLCNNE